MLLQLMSKNNTKYKNDNVVATIAANNKKLKRRAYENCQF